MWFDPPKVFPSIDQMAETEAPEVAAEVKEPIQAPAQAPAKAPAHAYEKAVLDSIHSFFQKRAKNPANYTFTPDGNLEIKGDTTGTIQLKRFVPLEPADRAALEEYRLNILAMVEGEYEKELQTLHAAWEEYRTTGSMQPVLASNQRATELDAHRNAIRSAVRNIIMVKNPRTRDVILSERYEERKMFAPKDPFDLELARLCFYEFMPEFDQGKYVADQEAVTKIVAQEPTLLAYQQFLKDKRKARIFFDTDSDVNGFLSPMWAVEFTMQGTRYSSAIQAYEAERAKELGMNELRASLLKTRSARTIRLMTRAVKGHPKDAKGLWLKIYTEIYQQSPALKQKLLATDTDTFVYADIREGPSGIGLAEKDSATLDPTKWKGENAVGVAQETVRTRLREGNLEEAAEGEVRESVITEEQQKKAKVGAIINARRA